MRSKELEGTYLICGFYFNIELLALETNAKNLRPDDEIILSNFISTVAVPCAGGIIQYQNPIVYLTIRLRARDFYEVIVNHLNDLIEIECA